LRLFLDNTFAPRAGRSLAAIFEGEHVVQHLRDRWAGDAPDPVWLPTLAQEGGWVIFTHDRHMNRDHGHVIQACRTSNVLVVFLARSWARLTFLEQHAKLLMYFQRLLDHLDKSRPGTVLLLGPRGALTRI
jgi:hypothetical protein